MFKNSRSAFFLIMGLLALASLCGCKNAVPIVSGAASISAQPPQGNFVIYPAGTIAVNSNSQKIRASIGPLAMDKQTNGSGQIVTGKIILK